MASNHKVVFKDNSDLIIKALEAKKKEALELIGKIGVSSVRDYMDNGYPKPVRDTGRLIESIDYQVTDEDTVEIGTEVEYGWYVHDGTYKMAGRPYLIDGILNGAELMQSSVTDLMKED